MTMKTRILMAMAATTFAGSAVAQVVLYSGEGFRGSAYSVNGPIANFDRTGFNDRASSAIVERGRWEVCEDAGFSGRCVVLRAGNYPSLGAMGMNNLISSARPVGRAARYPNEMSPPPTAAVYEYRQRPDERLFEVPVAAVHAVVGPPEQRCWVERQQVTEPSRGDPNVPGAIIGGILGGVLGHQVGGGRGKDVATAGGAVAGVVIGANVGRSPGNTYTQDVQKCAAVPGSARPEYWDVTYHFNGLEHHVQMGTAPGPTIWVNAEGEPRG